MPHKVRIRPRARADLLDIWKYIAAENEAAATRVIARINDIFDMLGAQPEAGRRRPELSEKLRSFPVATHVVFYEIGTSSVEIVRVLHGHRDITDDLAGE